jgi:hypothetical protein
MRVSAFDLIANEVNVLRVGLRNPSFSDKYLAKAIVGLDAAEVIPKFYGFGLVKGERFYDYAMNPREIAMRVELNPNYLLNETHSDLRDDLYRAISSSRTGLITIRLRDGASVAAEITGQIIKFEVPHFSKVPELQLTLKCEDPIFRAISTVNMVQADFLSASPLEVTDAISTCPHGLYMEFVALTDITGEFIIQNKATSPDWIWSMNPTMDIEEDDIVRISSVFSDKFVTIERGGIVTPVANSVALGSMWPVIFPGQNQFFLNQDFTDISLTELSYRPAFWGV